MGLKRNVTTPGTVFWVGVRVCFVVLDVRPRLAPFCVGGCGVVGLSIVLRWL